jgi:uncharacterized protein YegP (UPF0339 family)
MARPASDAFVSDDSLGEKVYTRSAEQFIWRLIWSNNREIGRGAGAYPTFVACQAAVELLRSGFDRIKPEASVDPERGQWTWRVCLDSVTLAVRGRHYQRERECQSSLKTFLMAVPTAHVGDQAITMETRSARSHYPVTAVLTRRALR